MRSNRGTAQRGRAGGQQGQGEPTGASKASAARTTRREKRAGPEATSTATRPNEGHRGQAVQGPRASPRAGGGRRAERPDREGQQHGGGARGERERREARQPGAGGAVPWGHSEGEGKGDRRGGGLATARAEIQPATERPGQRGEGGDAHQRGTGGRADATKGGRAKRGGAQGVPRASERAR